MCAEGDIFSRRGAEARRKDEGPFDGAQGKLRMRDEE